MKERGIVIQPKYQFDGEKLSLTTSIENIDLRFYLFYWDKIDFPTNNIFFIGSSPEIQYLADSKVLTRTHIEFHRASPIEAAWEISQVAAYEMLNRKEPGNWSIAQNNSSLQIPNNLSRRGTAVEMELYNALPVPSDDVPLEGILEFKERYRSELIAFRSLMDELYLAVISSGDVPRAKIAEINRLEIAIRDLNDISRQSFPFQLMSSLKVELNIGELLTKTVLGASISMHLNFNLANTLLVSALSGLSSTIKFEVIPTRKPRHLPRDLQAYAYLHLMQQNFPP